MSDAVDGSEEDRSRADVDDVVDAGRASDAS